MDLAQEPLPESLAERHAGIPCGRGILSSSFQRAYIVDRLARLRKMGGGADLGRRQVAEEVGDVFEGHPPPALLQLSARLVEGDAQSTARKGDRGCRDRGRGVLHDLRDVEGHCQRARDGSMDGCGRRLLGGRAGRKRRGVFVEAV